MKQLFKKLLGALCIITALAGGVVSLAEARTRVRCYNDRFGNQRCYRERRRVSFGFGVGAPAYGPYGGYWGGPYGYWGGGYPYYSAYPYYGGGPGFSVGFGF